MRIIASSCLLVLLSFQWGWSQSAPGSAATGAAAPAKAKPATTKPKVRIETTLGGFTLELDPEKAPISVKNFLNYVDQGFYAGTIFHRVIRGFMIQGGGFTEAMQKKQTQAPIKLEAGNGLSNLRGTVAMARTNVRDSATSQFFVNVVDNRNLDRMGGGYAVFGKVIDGIEVVDKIRSVATTRKGGYRDVPTQTVVIKSAKRL